MPEELLVIVFHRSQHAIADVEAAQLVFTPGTQLMVMKNQLPSATNCGIVCGSFLRTGKSMWGV
jgi:hypothetical protein